MLPQDEKMHFSNLKKFALSPAHYAVSCDSEHEDSTAFRIGRAVHAWILQDIQPLCYSEGVRRGKEWIAFCDKAFNENNIKTEDILNQSEYDDVVEMVASIKRNTDAMKVINEALIREESIDWMRDGVPCSGRIDAHSENTLVEIKMCANASPRKFLWDAHKFGYHAQMAWYDIGLGTKYEQFGTKWREHYIVAVESSAPYSCVVYRLDNLRIDQGHTLCEEWLSMYKECEESGIWPSYAKDQPVIWDAEIIIEDDEDDV